MTKPLVWLRDEIATPPFSRAARVKAGVLLRYLQDGEVLAIVIAAVFRKTTRATPPAVINECKRRLSRYDAASRRED
ncbi:MAG: hypothetical protein Q7W44_10545 [Coriobacteriia bacterium]|nr:hypothetical protein [Coriobacteriia bacterium]